MNKGILIFGHNNQSIDYLKLAEISARLAMKKLSVPVSLITDKESRENSTFDDSIFDKIIEIDSPQKNNYRIHEGKSELFLNDSRQLAFELTPYDRTLLIDSDLLIFDDQYSHYWDYNEDFMITDGMIDFIGNKLHQEDLRVSDIAMRLRWATAMMFTKNQAAKLVFDTMKYIKTEYRFVSDIHKFNPRIFRNDIAFTLANHIYNGFVEGTNLLPSIIWMTKTDTLINVNEHGLHFSVDAFDKTALLSIKNSSIHIMKKQDILKFEKEILSL